MNERIRELAKQARCFTETYDNELLSEPALLYCFHEDDFEKFAELIVGECARLLEKEANSSHDEGTESYNALMRESQWLKRYFGVES